MAINIYINNYFECKWTKYFNQKTKGDRVDKKSKTHLYDLQETHFRPKDTGRLKVRAQRNIYHANGCQKKARVAIFISDKIVFKTKTITRNKEEQYSNCRYLCILHRSTQIHKTVKNEGTNQE